MHSNRMFTGLFTLSACLTTALTHASTLHVSTNGLHAPPFTTWHTAATNIQAAVDYASSGDTVLVSNGIYNAGTRISTYIVLTRLIVTNAVTVRSVNGPQETEIHGSAASGGDVGPDAVRCVYLADGAYLIGFTLATGYTAQATYYGDERPRHGGGAYLDHGGIIEDCIVRNCRALGAGGGVFCERGGTVLDTEVCHNHATSKGGGIGFYKGGSASRCRIHENTVNVDGGGVSFNFGGQGLFGCTVWSNRALYADGGAVDIYASSPTIRNCLIYGNTAGSHGGAVRSSQSTPTIQSTTIYGNAADTGGGVYSGFDDMHNVKSCILYSNSATLGQNYYDHTGIMYLSHCCTVPMPPLGEFNLTNEPGWFAPEQGDFHLTAQSPCIDAGGMEPWMNSASDGDGDPRVFNGTNDIGYDEAALRCVSISFDAKAIQTSWSVVPGADLRLYACTNLLYGGRWETSHTGIAAGISLQCTDTNEVTGFKAYRLHWVRD